MADEIVGQQPVGTQETAPPAEQQAATTTTAPPPEQSGGAQQTAPASAAPASSPEYIGVLEHARQRGVNVGQFTDDNAYVDHLILASQQVQQYQQAAQYWQQQAQAAAQQQAQLQQQFQPQTQPKKEPWFQAPEYNAEWENALTTDANGNVVVKPGYPPEILQKYHAARNHQRQFLNKLSFDPLGAIGPGIKEYVEPLIQQALQERLGAYQDTQFANNFVQENSSWLLQRDQNGNVVVDPMTHKPIFSESGRGFANYINQLDAAGMRDVKQQQQWGIIGAQRDYYKQELEKLQRQLSANQTNQQQKQQFIAPSQPNVSGAANGTHPGQPPAIPGNASIAQMLKTRFQQAGFTSDTPLE